MNARESWPSYYTEANSHRPLRNLYTVGSFPVFGILGREEFPWLLYSLLQLYSPNIKWRERRVPKRRPLHTEAFENG